MDGRFTFEKARCVGGLRAGSRHDRRREGSSARCRSTASTISWNSINKSGREKMKTIEDINIIRREMNGIDTG